jgi:hypothetical protein
MMTALRPCCSRCQAFSTSPRNTRSVSMRSVPQPTLDISCRTASIHISGDASALPDPAPRISNRELRSTAAASEIVGPALSPAATNRTLDDAGFKSLGLAVEHRSQRLDPNIFLSPLGHP